MKPDEIIQPPLEESSEIQEQQEEEGIEWKVFSPAEKFNLVADTIEDTLLQETSKVTDSYKLLRTKTVSISDGENVVVVAQDTDSSAAQLRASVHAIQAVLRDDPGKPLPIRKLPGDGNNIIALDLIPNKIGQPIRESLLQADVTYHDVDWLMFDKPKERARIIAATLVHTTSTELNDVATGAEFLAANLTEAPGEEGQQASLQEFVRSIHGGAKTSKAYIFALGEALRLPLEKPLPVYKNSKDNQGKLNIVLAKFNPKGFSSSPT